MSVPSWLVLNPYVAILSIVLLGMTLSKKSGTRQDSSFVFMLSVILILLIADSFSKAYVPGNLGLMISKAGTYFIFAFDPVGYLAALIYIDSWTSGKKDHVESVFYGIVIGYVCLNFVLVTVSAALDLRWFYCFAGASHTHTHGSLFVLRGLINMIFCAVISLYIFLRRRKIRTQYTLVVIMFPMIILFSGFLQVFVGGASYEYAGSVLACLLLFVKVQAHNIDDDYLTGLLNRRGFMREMEYQSSHYRREHPFAVYFVDLDFFKVINDEYGHLAGDEALITLSEFLVDVFGREARIGRYGGDEFIVLAFEKDTQQAERKLNELKRRCDEFNQRQTSGLQLCFSSGFAFYDPDAYPGVDPFFRHIDDLMYQEKKSHHALRNSSGVSSAG